MISAVPKESQIETLKSVLTMLPRSHRIVLKYLLAFLVKVSKKSEINKMTPANIAIVFAPNLLKPIGDDIMVQITDSAYSNSLMELFVTDFEEIFKVKKQTKTYLFFSIFILKNNNNYISFYRMNLIQEF